MYVCVCVCIWLAGSSSLHVSFPKPFLKSRCELPIKEKKLTVLKGRRAADEDSLSGSPSALSGSISSQDSREKGDLGTKVGAVEGVAQGCGEWLKSCVIQAWNSPPLLSRTRRQSLSGAAQDCRQRPASQKGPRLRGGSAI